MNTNKLMAVAAVMCMLSVCTFAVFTAEEQEESDAIAISGLIVIGMFLTTAVCGKILGDAFQKDFFAPHENGGAGNDDTVKQQYRSAEAKKIIAEQNNMIQLITTKTTSTAPTLQLISTYAMRQAEISCAEIWQKDVKFDMNDVLKNSVVYDRMAAEAQAAAFYIGETFRPLDNLIQNWNNSDVADTYGKNNMQVGFKLGGTEYLTDENSTKTPFAEYGMATTITDTNSDRIYIRSTDGFLYVDGGNAYITDSNGKDWTLNEGRNDLAAMKLPSGVYEAQPNRSYLGSITQVATLDTAEVVPGAALNIDDTAVLTAYNGQNVNILNGGSIGAKTELDFIVKHANYNHGDNAVSLIPAFRSISSVLGSCTYVVSKAAETAQAQWNIYNACGEASVYISQSALSTVSSNLNLTSEERMLITISAMEQMSRYYERHETDLKELKATLSLNAMQLLCIGDIYDEADQKIAEDVLFTPMTYLDNKTLLKGMNSWDKIGLAAVWGPADSTTGTGEAINTIAMNKGYSIDIKSMTNEGKAIDTFNLEVVEMPELITGNYENVDPTPVPPPPIDLSPFIFAIIMLAGAFVALLGYMTGNLIIMGIGAVVMVIGGLGIGLKWRFPWI